MDDPGVIATHYTLLPGQPAQILAGLRALPCTDRRDPSRRLMALEARGDLPPRARVLAARGAPVPHAMSLVDYGPGRDAAGRQGYYIIYPAPPGPALSATQRPWAEDQALQCLLIPAASALNALAEHGMTHRAIRPDNIFQAAPGEPVMLGPGSAVPPASLQPGAFEPAYIGMCVPAGRGEAGIADDVYALGVTLLWCLLGSDVVWPEGQELLRQKLELGSLAALTGGMRLPPLSQDLLSIMLAEDPDHRPSPAALMDPAQARGRRLATRPPRRASRALDIGPETVWSARDLALILAAQPEAAAKQLRAGAIDRWLRRMLGDSMLAVRLEEFLHKRAFETGADESRQEAVQLMRAISALDPLAPLVWRGTALFPSGLGALLAHAQATSNAVLLTTLEEVVAHEVIPLWCACQIKRKDFAQLLQDAKTWRSWLTIRGPMGGVRRLIYGLNPLLPCASPLLGGHLAVRLPDLLPALEAASAQADRTRPPIDAHIAAFVAARAEQPMLVELGHMESLAGQGDRVQELVFFAKLQQRTAPVKLPGLAGWLRDSGAIDLTRWRSLSTRKRLEKELAAQVEAGQITGLLALAQNRAAAEEDSHKADAAAARLAAIDAEIAALRGGQDSRAASAERDGHDIAVAGALLAALSAALALTLEAA